MIIILLKYNTNILYRYSVYSSFLSFVLAFHHPKLPKFTKLFWTISTISLYYNNNILDITFYFETFMTRITFKYNTNTLKRYSVYSRFAYFEGSFQHIKSPNYKNLFWMESSISLYYNYYVLEPLWNSVERLTQMY
jgi:hypothetical protein